MTIAKAVDISKDIDEAFEPIWENEFALCTSGTTASSKIYFYTGESVCYQVLNTEQFIYESKYIAPKPGDKVLAFLPLHHIFGFWHPIYGMVFMVHPYIFKGQSTRDHNEACKAHKVTHINTVPILVNNITKSVLRNVEQSSFTKQIAFSIMLNTSLFLQKINTAFGLKVAQKMFKKVLAKIAGPQVRCIIVGGSQVPYESLKVINGLGYFTTCGFGMTEVGITSCESSDKLMIRLSGSLGKPLKYNEYKIAGDEEVGELLIRGKSIHQGRLVEGNR